MARNTRTRQRRAESRSGCVPVEHRTSVFDRHFWLFGLGVVLVLVLTRTFDFTLLPPAYNGVYLTRPFCGLHSWDLADRAWGARSHVKYGLRYTKGCRTLVVGDPPPAQPQYYVNHPALETWVLAAWMLVFGTEDWSFRLSDVVLAIPALLLVLYVLRRASVRGNWQGDTCVAPTPGNPHPRLRRRRGRNTVAAEATGITGGRPPAPRHFAL